jgi:hypothetical protein
MMNTLKYHSRFHSVPLMPSHNGYKSGSSILPLRWPDDPARSMPAQRQGATANRWLKKGQKEFSQRRLKQKAATNSSNELVTDLFTSDHAGLVDFHG